ncbi:MAG: FAD:protein FMN transferase [Ruminococcaceae bacterium]|nr:FAD:protein FMN transferase [Oscillospiraceae bacterium]
MRKIYRKIAFCLMLALLPLFSCAPKDTYQTKYIFAMDTDVSIHISATSDVSELISECESLIYSIENKLSKTRTGSDVYRLNKGERVSCDAVTLAVLETAKKVYLLSGGAFDPTVSGLSDMWDECESANALPSAERLDGELSRVGFERVHIENGEVWLDTGTKIDLGGVGKGYAETAVAALIKENAQAYGVRGYMLDFGGMVGVFGEKAGGDDYRVGLRDPDDSGKNLGRVELSEGYVSVSGDYERYVTVDGEKYHHIIDPKTGYPANSSVRSVAVICDDGATADALSTAFFVMGYERSMEFYEAGRFEAVFFMSNGEIKTTDGAKYIK